jgi:hypothetical protein
LFSKRYRAGLLLHPVCTGGEPFFFQISNLDEVSGATQELQ